MRRRTSKITHPMTPIGPVPFVGRQNELTELKQHLAIVSLVSLHGALGSGKTRLVSELAPGLGARIPRFDRVEFFLGDRVFDISRAREELAYRPAIGVREAVRETAEWFRERGELS